MRYIDADRLKAEIERYENTAIDAYNPKGEDADFWYGKVVACEDLKTLIASLQQEQPELPNNERKGIPGRDFIPVDWVEACERYGKWKIVRQEQPPRGYDEAYLNECIAKASKTWEGVDADKYLDEVRGREQEQPEMDLEKEITRWLCEGEITNTDFDDYDDADIERTARHFYELGLNAKKEE